MGRQIIRQNWQVIFNYAEDHIKNNLIEVDAEDSINTSGEDYKISYGPSTYKKGPSPYKRPTPYRKPSNGASSYRKPSKGPSPYKRPSPYRKPSNGASSYKRPSTYKKPLKGLYEDGEDYEDIVLKPSTYSKTSKGATTYKKSSYQEPPKKGSSIYQEKNKEGYKGIHKPPKGRGQKK